MDKAGIGRFPLVRIAIAIAAEIFYITGRTVIVPSFSDGVSQELAWTVWRLLFVVLYLWLFADVLRGSSARRGMPAHPLLLVIVAISVAVMPLAGYGIDVDLLSLIVFFVTTPIAALREELFYRAFLQNTLERLVAPIGAITLTTVAFVAYHIGAQPMEVVTISSLASAGMLYGVLYQRTQNFWLVVGLHTVSNLVAMSPQFAVIGPVAALFGNFLVILGAVLWFLIDREKLGTARP